MGQGTSREQGKDTHDLIRKKEKSDEGKEKDDYMYTKESDGSEALRIDRDSDV